MPVFAVGAAQPEEGKEEAKAAGLDRRTPPKQPFKLNVEAGAFTGSEIIVMLGEVRTGSRGGLARQKRPERRRVPGWWQNGTGKTTFIRMLAGLLKSDEQEAAERDNDFERAEACRYGCMTYTYSCRHDRL